MPLEKTSPASHKNTNKVVVRILDIRMMLSLLSVEF